MRTNSPIFCACPEDCVCQAILTRDTSVLREPTQATVLPSMPWVWSHRLYPSGPQRSESLALDIEIGGLSAKHMLLKDGIGWAKFQSRWETPYHRFALGS